MNERKIIDAPTDQIDTDRQVREHFDVEALAGLADTIREGNIDQPISVRRVDNRFIVIDGERRLRAAKQAGRSTVPVMVVEGVLSQADVIRRQLVANIQREALSPLEQARGIEGFMKEAKLTVSQAAAKLGMTAATVSRSLKLLSLPESIRKQVETGRIPTSAGYELAQVEDAGRQAQLAEEVAQRRLTRDGLCSMRKRRRPAATTGPAPCRVCAALGGGRSITIAGPAMTLDSVVAWLEELLAKARKARPQGLELSTFIKMLRDQAKA